jgi:putative transposase
MPHAYFDPDASRYVGPRKSASASHQLDYHIVMPTKCRRGTLIEERAEALVRVIRAVCEEQRYLLLGLAVRPEHVHLLVGLPPSVAVSEAVKRLKGVTAARLRQGFGVQRLWADGYFVETVGWKIPAQITSYLDRQEQHHSSTGDRRLQVGGGSTAKRATPGFSPGSRRTKA